MKVPLVILTLAMVSIDCIFARDTTIPTPPPSSTASLTSTTSPTTNSKLATSDVIANEDTGSNSICASKRDGLYIGGCRWFYRCEDGKLQNLTCPLDLVVNRVFMYCDYPQKVDPPCGTAPNCTGVWDGNYPDYNRDCKFYYACLHNRFQGYVKCPASLFFDPTKEACDWPNLIAPPCGTKGVN